MRKSILSSTLFFALAISNFLTAQNAPDFTVTDSDGVEHELYADYLDQGTTVVIKFFFVACPPCNAIAADVQTLYESWGEGSADVEFMELTILTSDDDRDVDGYKNLHSLTFPGISNDGGAVAAVLPYRNGEFGSWRGTPSFAVIAPDGSLVYGTGGAGNAGKIANLDAAIAATGAQGNNPPQPATFQISISDFNGNSLNNVNVFISNADGSQQYPISGNSLSIIDLEDQFPGVTDPVLTFERTVTTGNARDNVSPFDMLLIQKHLLGLIPITDDALALAADAVSYTHLTLPTTPYV